MKTTAESVLAPAPDDQQGALLWTQWTQPECNMIKMVLHYIEQGISHRLASICLQLKSLIAKTDIPDDDFCCWTLSETQVS